MDCAFAAIFGQTSEHSLQTGPLIELPLGSFPSSEYKIAALSSQHIISPVGLLQVWRCLITTPQLTFFLRSGFPFFTVHTIRAPIEALGSLFSLPLILVTPIMKIFFAPVLSAQFKIAATGRPSVTLYFSPPVVLPRFDIV